MSNKTQTHVVWSDLHLPFQDTEIVKLAFQQAVDLQPHTIHLLGDILDFDQLSRFLPAKGRGDKLQDDLDLATQFLDGLQAMCPNSKIVWSEGNHEYRLVKYLRGKAPELGSLRDLTIPKLLGLRKRGITWRDGLSPYYLGNLCLTHGSLIRPHSGYTAKGMVDWVGNNVLFGHSHRLGVHHLTTWNRSAVGYENGCMCRFDMDYLTGPPNWQHGWSVVTVEGKHFEVEQVRIQERAWYFWRGRRHPEY